MESKPGPALAQCFTGILPEYVWICWQKRWEGECTGLFRGYVGMPAICRWVWAKAFIQFSEDPSM
jgi:hypothetical protein